MREISPALNMSTEEYFITRSPLVRQFIATIREQKAQGIRPRPSTTLVDYSVLLNTKTRAAILDQVAVLVDENIYGRAEMCMQFADLIQRSLIHLGLQARVVLGTAIYYSGNREVFRWEHAWVRIGKEIIDGNVDSIIENPMVPSSINIAPYWGRINNLPPDRKLIQNKALTFRADDIDVSRIWWPELKNWLAQNIFSKNS